LYGMNLLTLGDFFKVKYGQKAERLASIIMVPSYFGYIAGQLVALGLIFNVVTGLPVWEGIILCSFVVTVYTFIGGMWAISITDFIQSIVIVVGLVVLFFVLANKAGGIMTVMERVPAGQLKFFPSLNFSAVVSYFAAWSVLGLGSIPSQDVFQRVMSSGSSKIAVRSCYVAAFFYLSIALLPLFISLCVQQLYPLEITGDTQLTLAKMVTVHTPMVIQILFFGSLLSSIMSTTSSSLLAPSVLLSENIIKPLYKNSLSDKMLLNLTKGSVLLMGIAATVMAIHRTNIYELVGESSIITLVTLFVPLTAGLYSRKASSLGALLSMGGGLFSWLIFEWWIILDIPSLIPGLLISILLMFVGNGIHQLRYQQRK